MVAAKLMLNSLFGKLKQRKKGEMKLTIVVEDDEKPRRIRYSDNKEWMVEKDVAGFYPSTVVPKEAPRKRRTVKRGKK